MISHPTSTEDTLITLRLFKTLVDWTRARVNELSGPSQTTPDRPSAYRVSDEPMADEEMSLEGNLRASAVRVAWPRDRTFHEQGPHDFGGRNIEGSPYRPALVVSRSGTISAPVARDRACAHGD